MYVGELRHSKQLVTTTVLLSAYCMFDLSVYYLFLQHYVCLQYFDTVGWVF